MRRRSQRMAPGGSDRPARNAAAAATLGERSTAAIEQGLRIAEDFVLSVELGDGKTKPVRDDEKITVRAGDRFLAVERNVKVEVSVNDKPVVLEGARQTGASVKQAAIEQGVRIAGDFVLSIELGGGKTTLVGDDDEIVVRAGERFLAIENDDNS